MKPISIRFKCFGPYLSEQFIDFTQLEKSGLFLICGETGSGKTTILDAISYALYGRSSGALRGDLSVMRCKLAQPKDETLVEFIFDSGGHRYRFTRSLKYGRKNLNDSHDCARLEDGVFVPIFENPKLKSVNEKAEELIGLTYDQFRQVIVLPQGQFETLLVSKSEEKEKILVSLFHADRWQRIADELYNRVYAQDQSIKQQRQMIQAKLQDYGCVNLDTLAILEEDTAQRLAQLRKELESAELHRDAVKKIHDEALIRSKDFADLNQTRQTLKRLLERSAHFDQEERLLQMADSAEAATPHYAALKQTKKALDLAENQKNTAENNINRTRQTLIAARQARQNHESVSADYGRAKEQLVLLENVRPVYSALGEKNAALDAAVKKQKVCQQNVDSMRSAFEKADRAWMDAQLEQSRAMVDYQNAQRIYLSGIGGVLAQQLVDGMACPVCGSCDHPNPAKPAKDHITDAQLDAFNKAMNRANDAVSRAMSLRSEAEQKRNGAEGALHLAERETATAETEHSAALERKIAGIDTSAQLEAAISRLGTQIRQYENADRETADRLNDAVANEKAATAALETAQQSLTQAKEDYAAQSSSWAKILAETGFDNESQYLAACMDTRQKQQRHQKLIQFRTDLNNARDKLTAQQEALQDQQEPDLPLIAQQLQDVETAVKSTTRDVTLLQQRYETMSADTKTLTERSKKLDALQLRVEGDLMFAKRLRGDSGSSLQRYVLGVMLTAITREANRLLSNVYGGRYQLRRSDESTGKTHKKGLELEVYDSRHNAYRSVTTLSGGEKFLVALSLAIGLSTVVQAQGHGMQLEAMFVDEGFGSLDRESVNDALEVLQGISRSAGIVGIISHVDQLAETIPSKICITKGKDGSYCTINV